MVPLVEATGLTPVAKVSRLDASGAAPAVAGVVKLHGARARPVPVAGVGTGEVIAPSVAAGSELPPPPPPRPPRALLVPMAAVKGAAW